jgi:chromate reductase
MKKVIVLIGGISKGSLNRRFFEAVAALDAEGAEPSFDFTVFDIASLPFYSQDTELDLPAAVRQLHTLAVASDAVLIVTPEYNRSIPGVLKNALDWGSRPAGVNVWARKPAAIMGAAPSGVGTFGAQQHLRNVCSWLDMAVMNQPTVYFNASVGMTDASGTPTATGDRLTESSAGFMRKFLGAFEQWIELFWLPYN